MTTYFPITSRAAGLSGTRKRKFAFDPGHTVMNVDSYWDGGSKSVYQVHNIDSGLDIVPAGNAPFGASGRVGYALITGDVMIETGISCGKPATPRFCCKTEDSARVLAWLQS